MIISDIVWADLISWLYSKGLRMDKVNGEYRVYLPPKLANNLRVPLHTYWDEDGVSVRYDKLEDAVGAALKIMSVDVGAK